MKTLLIIHRKGENKEDNYELIDCSLVQSDIEVFLNAGTVIILLSRVEAIQKLF